MQLSGFQYVHRYVQLLPQSILAHICHKNKNQKIPTSVYFRLSISEFPSLPQPQSNTNLFYDSVDLSILDTSYSGIIPYVVFCESIFYLAYF